MKDFRDKLIEINFQPMPFLEMHIGEESSRPRQFECIHIGDYLLSIQADAGHYCQPKKTVDKKEYISMEIAIMKSTEEMEFVNLEKDPFFKDFDGLDDLLDFNDHMGEIFPYTPIDLIQRLYDYMIEKKQGI